MTVAILKNVRLSYPDLFKPGKPMNEGDTPKYGGQFIFSPDSEAAAAAKAAFTATATETFGPNAKAILGAMEKSKKCLRNGDENLTKDGAIRDGYGGNLYVVARNKAKPLLIGPVRTAPKGTNDATYSDGSPILTEEGGKPYGGCYVDAVVSVYAVTDKDKGGNGVFASIELVRFRKDGEPFGAGPVDADDYLDDLDDEDDDDLV